MPTFHKPHDQANRIRQTARQAEVSRRTLPKREVNLSKREVSASYLENSCSTVPVPHLHDFRAGPSFDLGANIAPNCLGGWNGLEDSEDCGSAGGHGNQHVCLRGAQVDRTKTVCPARSAIVASGRGRRLPTTSDRWAEIARHFRRQANEHMAIRSGRAVTGGHQAMSRRISNLSIRRCDLSQLAAVVW